MYSKFKNYLKLHVNSEKTVKEYIGRVSHFFDKYNEFNQESINSYLTGLIDEEKKSAFNLSVASFNKYATFKKVFVEFPKYRKIQRKNYSSLTHTEIEKEIIPYFSLLFKDYEKRALIFRFMILSLMRISEIVNLKKDSIDFETGKIYVNGKGDKNRITYIHKSIKDDLKLMVEQSTTEQAFDFNEVYIRYMFNKINDELNYKKRITPHTTRRAGARYLTDNGMNVELLKTILGHSSLDTTTLYLNYTDDEIQEEYNKIPYNKG